jgi:hypothetical protein
MYRFIDQERALNEQALDVLKLQVPPRAAAPRRFNLRAHACFL